MQTIKLRPIHWAMLFFLLIGVVQGFYVFAGASPLLQGELADTDPYLWLLRSQALIDGQSWFDSHLYRLNPPDGGDLNWSRPLDILILASATFPHFILDWSWSKSLFWGGAFLPWPLFLLLLLATAFVARQLFSPIHSAAVLPLVMGIVFIQPLILTYNRLGQPDQQTLFMIFMLLAFGFVAKFLRQQEDEKSYASWAAGGCFAIAFWITPEAQFGWLLALSFLLLLGLGQEQTRLPQHVLKLLAAQFMITVVAVFVERGSAAWQSASLDKISMLHVKALALMLCAGLVWQHLEKVEGLVKRILILISISTVWLLSVLLVCPRVLLGPAGDIDPFVMQNFLSATFEMRTLWPQSLAQMGEMFFWLGMPLCVLLVWPILCGRKIGRTTFAPWMMIYGLTLAFTLMGGLHLRLAQLAMPLASILLAACLRQTSAWSLLPRMIGRFALLVLPLYLGLFLMPVAAPHASASIGAMRGEPCMVKALAARLQNIPSTLLLADLNYGSELLYFTSHMVLSAPMHREAAGIIDSQTFLDNGAVSIVQRRGVGLVLICRSAAGGAWAENVVQGKINPEFLQHRSDLEAGGFAVYQVRR